MTARPIQITTTDGTTHDFTLTPAEDGNWAVTHAASGRIAGHAIKTGPQRSWSAHVRDSIIHGNEGESLHEEFFGDEYAAGSAVAKEYGRRFLEPAADDFEIHIPEGAEYHEDHFTIEQDENGENRQYTHDEVKDMDIHHVWTIVDSDGDGPYWAVPGFRMVNRDHYRVTKEAWADENAAREYVA